MLAALRRHWPEYLMEAAGLGLFMLSACVFALLLGHPGSRLAQALPGGWAGRLPMGLAMGATAIAIVYSPWGRRSGAHLNPAVTLTFWWLGKVHGWDAVFYAGAQFAGGLVGVAAAAAASGPALGHPAVRYAVTQPGGAGPAVAFGAEVLIAFGLMMAVLAVSNSRRASATGLVAGALVATYITVEAPLSGMSMNPARTLASALGAASFTALWIYFVAPAFGMVLAAGAYAGLAGARRVRCAKLNHGPGARCIFRCGYAAGPAPIAAAPVGPRMAAAVLGAALLVAVALSAPVGLSGQEPGPRIPVSAVETVGLAVSDVDRAVDFYSRVLTFEVVSDGEVAGPAHERLTGLPGLRARAVRMRLGEEQIELVEYLAPRGRPVPADSRSNDRWFQHIAIVVSDMDQAHQWLRAHRVRPISPGPQRLPDWNAAAGGIRAFYFQDPDGHPLELIQFPADKGDPRWQRDGDRVFRGIDHTAIVVESTERSLRFYRDVLGLAVAGGSENWGPEQERLNDVAGARLRITALRAGRGPGVELLEYLAPRTGRPAAGDGRVNDLVAWRTVLATPDAGGADRAAAAGLARLISPGRIALDGPGSPRAGALLRDPDGHALELRER